MVLAIARRKSVLVTVQSPSVAHGWCRMTSSASWLIFPAVRSFATSARTDINCHRASIARIGRLKYLRMYPTLLVQSDGSTINIRYHEPRKIIKMPLDLSTLSEVERRKRIEARKPRAKVVIEDDIEDDFDVGNYEHLWKK